MSRTRTQTGLKGYIAERKAELWLIDHGYEVYYNNAPTGHADMVIWDRDHDNPPTPIDVKTLTDWTKAQGGTTRHGVKILYINPDTGKCAWNPDLLKREGVHNRWGT